MQGVKRRFCKEFPPISGTGATLGGDSIPDPIRAFSAPGAAPAFNTLPTAFRQSDTEGSDGSEEAEWNTGAAIGAAIDVLRCDGAD
jgi:hypothetical protein